MNLELGIGENFKMAIEGDEEAEEDLSIPLEPVYEEPRDCKLVDQTGPQHLKHMLEGLGYQGYRCFYRCDFQYPEGWVSPNGIPYDYVFNITANDFCPPSLPFLGGFFLWQVRLYSQNFGVGAWKFCPMVGM